MKICIFGNKKSTEKLIEHLTNEGYDLACLVCLNFMESKKIEISGKSSLLDELCKKKYINIFKTKNYSLSDKEDLNFFKKEKFDLGICTGWQRLIPDNIIETFKNGIFGWHGSGFEFPNGRGRSPLNWSIRLGLKKIYHNCFQYASGADTGKVFDTKVITINDSDHIADLQRKALSHIFESSVSLIKSIQDNNLSLFEQPDYPFISFPSLNESSGELFIDKISSRSALQIIRSCSRPFPGAYFQDEQKIRLWDAEICKVKHSEMSSNNNSFIKKDILYLRFRDGWLMSNNFEYC